jgi:hypothetical protein
VIELGGLRPQTGFDIAQALAKGQLCKRHRQVLIQTSETLDFVMSTVTRHAATKGCQRQMFHQLCKNQLARMHRLPPRKDSSQGDKLPVQSSNRDQAKT